MFKEVTESFYTHFLLMFVFVVHLKRPWINGVMWLSLPVKFKGSTITQNCLLCTDVLNIKCLLQVAPPVHRATVAVAQAGTEKVTDLFLCHF